MLDRSGHFLALIGGEEGHESDLGPIGVTKRPKGRARREKVKPQKNGKLFKTQAVA